MSYSVLYAEDDSSLAELVIYNLEAKGYKVHHAYDGEAALQLFKNINFSICLLDVMMPIKDGYTLADDIRKLRSDVPIIFLSAKSLDEDVVKGFKSGGNDYMKKPFSIMELIIRMEALLIRSESSIRRVSSLYQFCNCTLDANNQQLKTPHARYDLSYKESALLELLIQHRNAVLERQIALIKIWGNDSIYNGNSMNVFMTHLRRMLKDDPGVQVISIRNQGYKLTCS